MIARLRPEKREEYLELHRSVWPHVAETTRAAGIRDFTIFVLEDVIVGCYEYDGDDLDAAQARMDADPVMQDWWRRTGACQLPFDPASSAPNWVPLEEVWHQD
jgi:L-rhamnose mutarotase